MKTFIILMVFVFAARLINCQSINNDIVLTEEPTITFGIYTDKRDNHVYKLINIGGQTWFAENIDYQIPGSWYYCDTLSGDSNSNRLYVWEAAMQACPKGWHLPSDKEWSALEGLLDDRYSVSDSVWNDLGYRGYNAGQKLKILLSVNNSTSCIKKLSGYRSVCGLFNQSGKEESFWTSTEIDSVFKWFHGLNVGYNGVYRAFCHKNYGFSVRCVKDK